jgi:hypothetical protein
MLKRLLQTAFLPGIIVLLLISCDAFMNISPKNDTGNLVISFPRPQASSRAAVPGVGTLAQLAYNITLTNGSETLSAVVPVGQSDTVLSVRPGAWEIQADAYIPVAEPIHVGTGSAQVTVKAGQRANAVIKMIFDNTVPAGVTVRYDNVDYTAVREGTIYTVEFPGTIGYDTTKPFSVTVQKAVEDQDLTTTGLAAGIAGYFTGTPQIFRVEANAAAGYSTDYTVKHKFRYRLVDTATGAKDLKTRFGITTNGTQGVTDTFNALHELISNPFSGDSHITDIQLGDWIDLESLTVARYHTGTEAPDNDSDSDTNRENGAISTANTDLGSHGKLLRIIVVGKNSFNGINGNNTPHVVFQFQNVPGYHRMNETATNVGGYAASEMRTYLTGNFYAGLTGAGVPDAVVWAPSRRAANGGSGATAADTITDKLWLPTEYEMFGNNTHSNGAYEGTGNQADFTGYYTTDTRRTKYRSTNAAHFYWEASPIPTFTTDFCFVDAGGFANNSGASAAAGVAPAFCIK